MSEYKVGDKLAFIYKDPGVITISTIVAVYDSGRIGCGGHYLRPDLTLGTELDERVEVYPLSDEDLDQIATIIKGEQ